MCICLSFDFSSLSLRPPLSFLPVKSEAYSSCSRRGVTFNYYWEEQQTQGSTRQLWVQCETVSKYASMMNGQTASQQVGAEASLQLRNVLGIEQSADMCHV